MIAMMIRFYGLSKAEIGTMTLKEFGDLFKEISNILKLEYGDEKSQSLTGEVGFAVAQTIFPKGTRRR